MIQKRVGMPAIFAHLAATDAGKTVVDAICNRMSNSVLFSYQKPLGPV
ncbi:MAG: hypothetical protein ACK5SI_07370 [Planctomycetia bacterium]|jgi:hypothetical protein